MVLAIFSLVLLFSSSSLMVFSSSGFMTAVGSIVDGHMAVMFWLCVLALLLVLLAGVKMCIGFSSPLHWLK